MAIFKMDATDFIKQKNSLLQLICGLKDEDGNLYKTLSLVICKPEDGDSTILKNCVIKIKVYNKDYPWGWTSKKYINEHTVYIDKNGGFVVERPLYDGGFLVDTPQNPGPSGHTWEQLFGTWLDDFCPRVRQTKRAQQLRNQILCRAVAVGGFNG